MTSTEPVDVAAPCERCGRRLLDIRATLGREALRGSVPLCAVPGCPLVRRVQGFAEPPTVSGTELYGPSPPSVFVGRFGYPRVSVGPLLPPGAAADPRLEDPSALAGLDIATVLEMRSRLVRSKSTVTVENARDPAKALDVARELALTDRPVDTEVTLAKAPRLDFSPRVDATGAPMGPSVDVVRARLTAHAPVPRAVERLVGDVHADAATGLWELYDAGVPLPQLTRLLSVGLLGEETKRRLVPTRWSITATDDTLGRALLDSARTRSFINGIELYTSSLFGNDFHVVLFPAAWRFEMVEAWQEGNGGWGFAHDQEGNRGRTTYAASVTGAYYAARLGILEHLERRQRQAAAFVYREITDAYWAPLGVWVIREAVRRALETKPLAFGEVEAVLAHVHRRARCKTWPALAKLPRDVRTQRTLLDFP